MQKRGRLCANGVNGCGQGRNLGPPSVAQPGMPNIGGSVALARFPHKKQFSPVRRQAGLRLPLARVDSRAGILRFRPTPVRAKKRKIDVAGSVAFFSLAGCKSHQFLIAPNANSTFVPNGVESSGEREGLGPGALNPTAGHNYFITARTGLPSGKIKACVVARNTREVVQFKLIHRITKPRKGIVSGAQQYTLGKSG